MLRIAVLILVLAGPAPAGPWPRAAGEGFVSFAVEADPEDGGSPYATLYAEYGIGAGRVLGLDLGRSEDYFDKAVLFFRQPFGAGDTPTVAAWEIGLGMVDERPSLRTGLSVGRGVTLGAQPGWTAFDLRTSLLGSGNAILEADLTVGAETGNGNKWLVQLRMAAPTDSAAYVNIAPAWALRVGPGRHLLIGVTAGVLNSSEARLGLGFWQAF